MHVDWDSWLLFLSVKGYIYVDVVSKGSVHHHFIVESPKSKNRLSKDQLMEMIAARYASAPSSSVHTRGLTPTLVLKEDDLLHSLQIAG